ncbi:hypothetical protein AJ80_00489 [Polytolypa hystricis UAMH7299]|uniref:Cupin type-2 domain-containing protein n=1 Tax=Polytolypa hystricis (strain UAMH7299) TaxID=1447883 RepID=A0A2B7Z3R7_POLH7|nr:hypothetical protein AJ80_00489 [Polytolypa hystricis UAMH7299]
MADIPPPPNAPPKTEIVHFHSITTRTGSKVPDFRRVAFTGLYSQVVLMTVHPNEEHPAETLPVDKTVTFTSGKGEVISNGKTTPVGTGDLIIIPAGTMHQVSNTDKERSLVTYIVYSPAYHSPITCHETVSHGFIEEGEGFDRPARWSQQTRAENIAQGLVPEVPKKEIVSSGSSEIGGSPMEAGASPPVEEEL